MSNKYYIKKKPVYYCVLEGKNKTEKNYLGNINRDFDSISIKLKISENTDIDGMIKHAKTISRREGLNSSDRVFVLVDDDNNEGKIKKIQDWSKCKNSPITIVVSSPCFENWLLSYSEAPRFNISSDKAIDNLKKTYLEYTKSGDIYQKLNKTKTSIEAINIAINNYNSRSNFSNTDNAISISDFLKLIISQN